MRRETLQCRAESFEHYHACGSLSKALSYQKHYPGTLRNAMFEKCKIPILQYCLSCNTAFDLLHFHFPKCYPFNLYQNLQGESGQGLSGRDVGPFSRSRPFLFSCDVVTVRLAECTSSSFRYLSFRRFLSFTFPFSFPLASSGFYNATLSGLSTVLPFVFRLKHCIVYRILA